MPTPSPTVAPSSPAALQAVRTAAARTLELTASVSLNFAALSSTVINGEGTFDFASAKGSERIEQPVGTETTVFLPTFLFDDPPAQDAVGLPHGRTWIMAEPAEHIANATSFSQFVLQIQGKNPMFLLAQVAWGAVAAAPLQEAVINGERASGYLASVDLGEAATTAAGPAASALASSVHYEEEALGAGSQSSAPLQQIRAWVDSSGDVVRVQASPPGSGVGTTTMTFTAFGGRVDPSRPPRAKTIDLASLAPGGDHDRD